MSHDFIYISNAQCDLNYQYHLLNNIILSANKTPKTTSRKTEKLLLNCADSSTATTAKVDSLPTEIKRRKKNTYNTRIRNRFDHRQFITFFVAQFFSGNFERRKEREHIPDTHTRVHTRVHAVCGN